MKNEEMIVGYWVEKSKERMEGGEPFFVLAEVVCEKENKNGKIR